jgi:hypothetical protein
VVVWEERKYSVVLLFLDLCFLLYLICELHWIFHPFPSMALRWDRIVEWAGLE